MLLSAGAFFSILLVVPATARHRRKESYRESMKGSHSVAVIVPAFNEEKVICKTIASVLASARKDFKVLVVDDGSTDLTAHVAREAYASDPRVKVFVKTNGGKSAAANFAVSQTDAEVVICIDADTILAVKAIPLLVRHFSDPKVGAVAGTAIVGNRVNLLTRFQAIEYVIGQYLDRRAFALFNATGIVPGAIGAWRREALLGVGGYAGDTLAEDADATFAVTRAGWKVIYEPEAEARTEAPETLRAFLKQRHRWMFGMLQVVYKHAGAMVRGPKGLRFITIPNVLIFQFGFSFLIPILDVVAIADILIKIKNCMGPEEAEVTAGNFVFIKWWMLFQALDMAAMASALKVANAGRSWTLIPMLLLQRFLYWPLIYWTAAISLIGALKGRSFGWRKLARTGSVSMEPALLEVTEMGNGLSR
jgi:cellulose synthase/poly-beta-1,6-N-acetylglucosamine synthase-like glycosyltransferase